MFATKVQCCSASLDQLYDDEAAAAVNLAESETREQDVLRREGGYGAAQKSKIAEAGGLASAQLLRTNERLTFDAIYSLL